MSRDESTSDEPLTDVIVQSVGVVLESDLTPAIAEFGRLHTFCPATTTLSVFDYDVGLKYSSPQAP